MADIFISYKREERDRCLAIYERLTALKFSVWFDARLESGTPFDEEIERELEQAQAVLVLWSPLACKSRWVRDEATLGLNRNKLVSVRISDCEPPIGFRQIHNIDLFDADLDEKAWSNVLGSLGKLTARTGVAQFAALQRVGTLERWVTWLRTFHDDPLVSDAVAEILRGQEPGLQAELAKAQATLITLDAEIQAYKEADLAQANALREASRKAARLQIELDRLRAAEAKGQPPGPKQFPPETDELLLRDADRVSRSPNQFIEWIRQIRLPISRYLNTIDRAGRENRILILSAALLVVLFAILSTLASTQLDKMLAPDNTRTTSAVAPASDDSSAVAPEVK